MTQTSGHATTVDAIVIGAGHNGLTAACYLTRAGLDVMVVEAQADIGGMSHSGSLIAAAPQHVINTCALDSIFLRSSNTVRDLGLAQHGFREIEIDPSMVYLHPDGASIAIWRDAARTAAEIGRFSAADAAAYLDLMRIIDAAIGVGLPYLTTNPVRPDPRTVARMLGRAARSARALRKVPRTFIAPVVQTVDERFRHPIVRDYVAALCGAIGPIDNDGGGLSLMLFGYSHRFGGWRIAGGTQRLPIALRSVLESAGGRVRTGAAVEQILVTDNRARGVLLTTGEEITARRGIVAACDPRTTLGALVPAGTLDASTASAVGRIPAWGDGWADLKVDLALSGRVTLSRHMAWRADGLDLRVPGIVIGGYEAALANYRTARAGEMPAELSIFMAVPTGADPSQAPDGQDTVYLWANPMPLGGPTDQPGTASALIARASGFYEGLEKEIGRRVESPTLRAGRVGSTNGSVYHADMTLLRMGPLRPAVGLAGYRTPVEGLFLGGAGSHPSAGVTGLPGRLAAREFLRRQR